MFVNGLRKTDGVYVWSVVKLTVSSGRDDILNTPCIQIVKIQPITETLHQSTNNQVDKARKIPVLTPLQVSTSGRFDQPEKLS